MKTTQYRAWFMTWKRKSPSSQNRYQAMKQSWRSTKNLIKIDMKTSSSEGRGLTARKFKVKRCTTEHILQQLTIMTSSTSRRECVTWFRSVQRRYDWALRMTKSRHSGSSTVTINWKNESTISKTSSILRSLKRTRSFRWLRRRKTTWAPPRNYSDSRVSSRRPPRRSSKKKMLCLST